MRFFVVIGKFDTRRVFLLLSTTGENVCNILKGKTESFKQLWGKVWWKSVRCWICRRWSYHLVSLKEASVTIEMRACCHCNTDCLDANWPFIHQTSIAAVVVGEAEGNGGQDIFCPWGWWPQLWLQPQKTDSDNMTWTLSLSLTYSHTHTQFQPLQIGLFPHKSPSCVLKFRCLDTSVRP